MERNRSRSASPLVQLRGESKSSSSLLNVGGGGGSGGVGSNISGRGAGSGKRSSQDMSSSSSILKDQYAPRNLQMMTKRNSSAGVTSPDGNVEENSRTSSVPQLAGAQFNNPYSQICVPVSEEKARSSINSMAELAKAPSQKQQTPQRQGSTEEGTLPRPLQIRQGSTEEGIHRPRNLSKSAEIFLRTNDESNRSSTAENLFAPIACLMVRSKSSFSIHINSFSASAEPKMKSIGSDHSLGGIKEQQETTYAQQDNQLDATSTIMDASSPEEEGFLRDIIRKGFYGIWNHPVARLYVLMYLIWRGQENLMILRMEIIDYRNNFQKLSQSYRLAAAKRLKKLYLAPNAFYPPPWPMDPMDSSITEALEKVLFSIDTPEITTFDDIGFLALQTLEKVFLGQFNPEINSADTAVEPSSPSKQKEQFSFREGPFYQAMLNDLGGTSYLTGQQYRRAVERVIDICNNVTMEMGAYENILLLLEEFGLESEFIRKDEKKKIAQVSMTKSSSNIFVEEAASPSSATSSKSPTNRHLFDSSAVSHTFLPARNDAKSFCEYCYDPSLIDGEKALYRCETCGIKSHKNCRNYMTLSCIKTSSEGEKNAEAEHGSDAIRLIQEKLVALQREVDIELKIQEGLGKMVKAKGSGKTAKKNTMEMDILEKNSKRLDVLKHEMQKRKVQLQTMQLALAANPAAPRHVLSKKISNRQQHDASGNNNQEAVLMDTGLLRVVVIDPATKMEFKKAVYVTENQSTVEVIEMILNKCNLSGIPNEFSLSYTQPEGGRQVLKDEDRPNQIEDIIYANTLFFLEPRANSKQISKNDPLIKKQQEILSEILDSEVKYLEDLKMIDSLFYQPLKGSGLLSLGELYDIFFNLDEIIGIHDVIGTAIFNLTSTTNPTTGHQLKLTKIIDSFLAAVMKFSCYEKYCGNQYQQRAVLKRKMAQSIQLSAIIQKCETNPKLHKLSIADMLMKPMQKITRYPLLFKRLLPNLVTDSQEFISLSGLVTEMEHQIFNVNETVRRMEAKFRIKMIDQTMDFGIVSDKFRIATEDRELILENTLQYLNKAGSAIEVIVLLFSDMILVTKRSKKVEGGYTLFKAPIPLENAVLIDQNFAGGKRGFQIAHQKQEIHSLQAYSDYDKKSWLQEAEATRTQYLTIYTHIELTYVRLQLNKNRAGSGGNKLQKGDSSFISEDATGSTSYLGSFFFKNSGKTDGSVSSEPTSRRISKKVVEDSLSRRISRKNTVQQHGSHQRSSETKITAQELLSAKTQLSQAPSARNLVKLASFKTNSNSASRLAINPEEIPVKSNFITSQELEYGKTRLSPLHDGPPTEGLTKTGSFSSLSNVMDKLKKTFKSRPNHEFSNNDPGADM